MAEQIRKISADKGFALAIAGLSGGRQSGSGDQRHAPCATSWTSPARPDSISTAPASMRGFHHHYREDETTWEAADRTCRKQCKQCARCGFLGIAMRVSPRRRPLCLGAPNHPRRCASSPASSSARACFHAADLWQCPMDTAAMSRFITRPWATGGPQRYRLMPGRARCRRPKAPLAGTVVLAGPDGSWGPTARLATARAVLAALAARPAWR